MQRYRDLIFALATRHRLPAVYAYRSQIMSGGLMSYGLDNLDQYRRAAGYLDRISAPKSADRGPAALQKLVESEVARITPVIKAAGVTAEGH